MHAADGNSGLEQAMLRFLRGRSSLALAAVALEDHVDVAGRAQDHRTPLVDIGGHEVKHALHRAVEHAGGGDAARRLADERHL